MSNVLKSRSFLGVVVVAAVVVAFAMVATTAFAAYTHTSTLKMGSTGSQVLSLQQTLNGAGFLVSTSGAGSPGMETSYFGSRTKAAVMAFQSARGLVADGVVGPITGAALSGAPSGGSSSLPAGCLSSSGFSTLTGQPCSGGASSVPGCLPGYAFSPTTGESCTGGSSPTAPISLAGGAGSITVDDLADFQNEEIGEGDDGGVLAFEVEADGSDVQITSIKVEFVQNTPADSEDLTDYAKRVFVMFNGKEVGSADARTFSESNDIWTKSITVKDVVVREDDTEKIEIWVEALGNLDSGDIDTDDWTVDVLNVRFVDGDGVYTTLDTDGDGLEQDFDFAAFATSADLELKLSLEDDSINESRAIDIHATNSTDNVSLLSFNLEAEGNSDIFIKDLSVNFDSVGVDLEDAVSTVYLFVGNKKIGSESITKNTATPGADETIEFDKINYTIKAGDKVEFIVKAKLKSLADGISPGDTISAQISATERALIDAEDESGEDVATGDMTGTAVGEPHAMYDKGIYVRFVGSNYVKTTSDTSGVNETVEFTLQFDVTAFGADIWVEKTCTDIAVPGGHTTDVVVSLDGDANGNNTTCTDLDSTGTEGTTGFRVREGQTERFTATVLGNGGEAGGAGLSVTFRARLEAIGYKVGSDAAGDMQYALNLDDFKSAAVTVFDR